MKPDQPSATAYRVAMRRAARLEDLDGPALNHRYFGGRERRLGGASAGRVMTAMVDASQR